MGIYKIDLNGLVELVQGWFVERNLHTFDGTAQLEKLKAVSYTHLTLPTICSV